MMKGERIELIPICETDMDFLLELRSNKKTCETIIFEPKNIYQQIKWFSEIKNAEYFCVWLGLKRIGFIGIFDIHSIHRRGKWTMRIHPDYWRQGYAREAMKVFFNYVFNHLNINKVFGDCFAENMAEVSNLRSAGFKEEGIWKDHYFHNGKYMDSINFAMTKKEYENNKYLRF